MKITIIIDDEKKEKQSPCKWENIPNTHYYDQVNDEVRPKDLNKYGPCQNCHSIYSCLC